MVSAGTSTAASAMTTRTAAPHARSRSRRPGSGRSLGIEKSSGSLAALLRFVISLSFRSAPSGGLEGCGGILAIEVRSEEHTSELQSLMRISSAVFCLQKKKKKQSSISDTLDINSDIKTA